MISEATAVSEIIHPDFGEVADVFRRQLDRTDGGDLLGWTRVSQAHSMELAS